MKYATGNYYHVYNRGCNREPIFISEDNYQHLARLINRFLPASVGVIAYCLMPNHYHFLLRSGKGGDIGRFIQRTYNAYTQSFNLEHGRSGTLFEGRAKRILVADERYAFQLSRYIHLNPVQAGLVAKPEGWPYSNYRDWVGLRQGNLVDQDFIKRYCGDGSDYAAFVQTRLDERTVEGLAPYVIEE